MKTIVATGYIIGAWHIRRGAINGCDSWLPLFAILRCDNVYYEKF